MTIFRMTNDFMTNILAVYNMATPEEKLSGGAWYTYANNQLREISSIYNFSFDAMVDATAALSPGIRWQSNMRGVEILADAIANDKPLSLVSGVAGYRRNIDKAAAILLADKRNDPFRHILSGPKVTAFADNLRNGDRNGDDKVTIDVHAYSVAVGYRYTVATMPHISERERSAIIAAYRMVAGIVGLSASQVQAITWVTWKRIHGI